MEIKLKAAFTGLTWLPSWIALTTSNLSPHLILEDETINYKVMRAIRGLTATSRLSTSARAGARATSSCGSTTAARPSRAMS